MINTKTDIKHSDVIIIIVSSITVVYMFLLSFVICIWICGVLTSAKEIVHIIITFYDFLQVPVHIAASKYHHD